MILTAQKITMDFEIERKNDMLLNFLKFAVPHVFTWLDTRALVIPKSKLSDVAARLGVTPEALQAENIGIVGEGLNLAGQYLNEHWGL